MSKRPAAITWIDTLKLTDVDHRALLEELQANVQPAANEQRAGARFHYDLPGGVLMKVFSAGSPPIHYLVRPRNLSAGGIGILHGNYLHVGTRCSFVMRKTDTHCAAVSGSVAWCRHFRGRVHELGVKFTHPINVDDFIDHSSGNASRSGRKTSATATGGVKRSGCVLMVGGSIDDQELIRYYLSSMGVDLRTAGDAMSALSLAESPGINLILLDDQLPGMSADEFVAALKDQNTNTPVTLLTAAGPPSSLTQSFAGGAGGAGVLTKPFSVDDVVRTAATHLPQAPGAATSDQSSPIFSENWSCVDMRPVILGFLSRLQTQLTELTHLAGRDDSKALLIRRCQDLKSAAGGYGYPPISRAAGTLLDAIALNAPGGGGGGEGVSDALTSLCQLCEAAARVRSAEEEPVVAVAA